MNTVLQQQLRNAGEQVEGTGNLLLQAAEEIAALIARVGVAEKRAESLQVALVKVRDDLNKTVHVVLGGK